MKKDKKQGGADGKFHLGVAKQIMRDTVAEDRRSNKAMAKEKETFNRRTNWDNAL